MTEIGEWVDEGRIDLMLVIGTSARVHPAAGYIEVARNKGARVAVVNFDGNDLGSASSLRKKDFLFVGDSATILPELFEPIIGAGDEAEAIAGA